MRRQGVYLVLIQDRALSYIAADMHVDLRERGIRVIFWPPFSLDLNLIEKVWYIMKNYLQDNYPENMGYDALRRV